MSQPPLELWWSCESAQDSGHEQKGNKQLPSHSLKTAKPLARETSICSEGWEMEASRAVPKPYHASDRLTYQPGFPDVLVEQRSPAHPEPLTSGLNRRGINTCFVYTTECLDLFAHGFFCTQSNPQPYFGDCRSYIQSFLMHSGSAVS